MVVTPNVDRPRLLAFQIFSNGMDGRKALTVVEDLLSCPSGDTLHRIFKAFQVSSAREGVHPVAIIKR
jgi:hypothetical protein